MRSAKFQGGFSGWTNPKLNSRKLIYPEIFHLGKDVYLDIDCLITYWSEETIEFTKVNPRNKGWRTRTVMYKYNKFVSTNLEKRTEPINDSL